MQEKLQESISIVDSNQMRQYNASEKEDKLNSQPYWQEFPK